jgi:hypothetical protein
VRDDALYVRVDPVREGIRVEVEARDAAGRSLSDLTVRADVRASSGASRSAVLTPAGPGRYVATVRVDESGPCFVSMVATGPGAVDRRATRGLYRTQDDERPAPADRALLARLAAVTGGRVIGSADSPFDQRERAHEPATPWLVGAALALFIAELVAPLGARAVRGRRAMASGPNQVAAA